MEKDNRIVSAMTSFGMSGLVFHGPLLDAHPEFQLKSVLQRTKDTAKGKYADIQIKRTVDELIDDPEVDLVVVNATNDTHYPHAKMALEAGKHVACEKPLANTLDSARQMVDAAKNAKGKTFVVGGERRVGRLLDDGDSIEPFELGPEAATQGALALIRRNARGNYRSLAPPLAHAFEVALAMLTRRVSEGFWGIPWSLAHASG